MFAVGLPSANRDVGAERDVMSKVEIKRLIPAVVDFAVVTAQFVAVPFMENVDFPFHSASDPIRVSLPLLNFEFAISTAAYVVLFALCAVVALTAAIGACMYVCEGKLRHACLHL